MTILFAVSAALFSAHPARADVKVGTGSFVRRTTTGSQVVRGIGFQPKALMFFYASTTNGYIVNGGTVGNDVAGSIGFGVAASAAGNAEGAVGTWSDAGSSSDTGGGHNAGDVIIMLGNDGVTYGEAQLTSFDANGFTLNWSTADSNIPLINYIAIGGDDITNASSSAFTLSTSAGDQSVSGMGFQPDFVLLLPAPDSRAAGTFTTAQALFSLGFGANYETNGATSTLRQAGFAVASTDAQSVSETAAFQNAATTSLIGIVADTSTANSGGDLDAQATIASFDSDGFTISKVDAPASARTVYYLAIKGGQWNVGNFAKKTSAGSQSVTGNGFMPKGIFFASTGLTTSALSTQDAATGNDRLVTMGAVGTTTASLAGVKAADASTLSATTSQVGMYQIEDDADTAPDPDSHSTTTKIAIMATAQALAYHSDASYASHNPDGFTINWTKADATASEFLYFAVGEVASTTQRAYAFFNDDGSSASSTIRRDTSTSTPLTTSATGDGVRQGERLVARIQIDETSNMATSTNVYRLQWENNTDAAGTWNDLGSTTQIAWSLSKYNAPRTRERRVPLPNARVTPANTETWQDSDCSVSSVSYTAGEFIAGSGTSSAISLRNQCTELAYAIETSNALRGKTYRLRLIDGVRNEDLTVQDGTYAAYPTFTIARAGYATASTTYWNGIFGATTTVAVDGAGYDGGRGASLAIGIDGNPVISHTDASAYSDLHLARCLNVGCTATTSVFVGGGTFTVGATTSLAISASGTPVIAIQEAGAGTNQDVWVYQCVNAQCTATTSQPVGGGNLAAGDLLSLSLGPDGMPFVMYRETTNNDLQIAQCLNTVCSATTTVALDGSSSQAGGTVGRAVSAMLNQEGKPIAAYYEENASYLDLRLANCWARQCAGATTSAFWVDGKTSDSGEYASLALGVGGNPVIASRDGTLGDLRLALCKDASCTSTSSTLLIDGKDNTNGGYFASLAVGIDGNPIVAHRDGTLGDLRLARCLNASCTATTTTAVDGIKADGSQYDAGAYASLALATDGNPLIAHYESDANQDLRLAVCHSLDCTTSYPSMSTSTAQATTSPYWFFDQMEYDYASTSNDVSATTTGLNARLVQQFSHASSTNTDDVGIVWEGSVSGVDSSGVRYGTTTTLEIYNFSGGYWEILATGTALTGLDYTLQATTTGTASNYYNGGNRVVARVVTATTSATTTMSLATDFINISFGAAGAALRQHHYRWRNDDGNESSASWAAAEDTALSSGVYSGDRRRLRFSISNANAAASNITYRLEYASSTCATPYEYIPVKTSYDSSEPEWIMDPSSYLSEEGASTAQLSVPSGKSFTAGYVKQSSNQTSAHSLTASQYSEFEHAIKSTVNASTGLNYCFRLTNAGTALTTYSVTPQITISAAARPQTGGGGGEGVGAGGQTSGGTGQGAGSGGEGSGSGGQTGGGTGQGGGGGSQEFVPWLMPWFGYLLDFSPSLL